MYKTQQSYDDFIQFDSDMSHVDDEGLFSLAERITVPEPHIINEMWKDDEKYNWHDVANCLRDNWHEIKGLVSLTDRDKMSDFAFDNHFEQEYKMKHKHAELMMQYAQDAMETDKPWERWESFIKDSWRDLGECFFFAKEECK